MMESQILGQLASTGIVGLLLVITLLALRAKDKELSNEKAARIADADKFLTLVMQLQKEVITAVGKLSDLVEIWEKRETERERTERTEARGGRRP